MADSEHRSNVSKRRKEIREMLLILIEDSDYKDMVMDAIDIATDKRQKPEVRLKAKEFIFSYSVSKAKQEIDMTSDDEPLKNTIVLNLDTKGNINEPTTNPT